MDNDYDDDYGEELHLERKAKEGWTLCQECGTWLHLEDYKTGSDFCECSQTLPEEDEE